MGEEQMLQMLLQESPDRTKGLTLSRKNRIRSQAGVGMHRSQDQVPLEKQRRKENQLPLEEVGKPGLREECSQSRNKSVFR